MDNKEIELKFKINENIKSQIIEYLDANGSRRGSSRQIDTYYIPNFKDFEIDGRTIECVRIRECERGSILTYKKIHYEASPIYCDEYETLVDKDQMEKFLFALGFSIQMIIDKTRTCYELGSFEFDFDSVVGLGELMEIELKGEYKTLDDIYQFVQPFGLTKSDVTYEGIQMMMKKAI